MSESEWLTLPDGRLQIKMYLDQNGERLVSDAIHEAVRDVAYNFARQNMDKILAGIDIKGLGNLIAIYASRELAKGGKDA